MPESLVDDTRSDVASQRTGNGRSGDLDNRPILASSSSELKMRME